MTDFIALVRALMTDRQMSAHALARAVPVDAGHLSRVLNGKRRPSLELAAGCDRVFGTGALLVEAVRRVYGPELADERPANGAQGVAARRRVLLGGIAMVAGAAGLLEDGPVTGRRLGRDDVVRIEAVTALYRSIDYEHGGGVLVADVARFAQTASALVNRSTGTAAPGLLSAVAAARQLAGWTAFDAGLHADAQRHLLAAERTAVAADDKLLIARVRYCQARQFQHLHHNGDALQTLLLAHAQLGKASTPAVSAMLYGARAASLAAIGDRREALDSLAAASGEFDRIDVGAEPPWMGFYDRGELLAQYGRVYRDLARDQPAGRGGADAAQAVTWGQHAVHAFSVTNVRSTVLNQVGLASSLFLAGEPERALAVAEPLIGMGRRITSRRIIDRIINLRRDLAPYIELRDVADFSHRLVDLGSVSG